MSQIKFASSACVRGFIALSVFVAGIDPDRVLRPDSPAEGAAALHCGGCSGRPLQGILRTCKKGRSRKAFIEFHAGTPSRRVILCRTCGNTTKPTTEVRKHGGRAGSGHLHGGAAGGARVGARSPLAVVRPPETRRQRGASLPASPKAASSAPASLGCHQGVVRRSGDTPLHRHCSVGPLGCSGPHECVLVYVNPGGGEDGTRSSQLRHRASGWENFSARPLRRLGTAAATTTDGASATHQRHRPARTCNWSS